MELKINKAEFAGIIGKGKYNRVTVKFCDGKVSLETYEARRDNVPFETVETATGNEATFGAFAFVDAATIRGAASFVRVANWTAHDAPDTAPVVEPVAEYAINFNNMKETVKYIREYASEDQERPNLLGVHFACNGDNLDVVATNGHILCCEAVKNTADNPGGDFAVTVANHCIDAALKLVGKKGDLGTMRVAALETVDFGDGFNVPASRSIITFDGLPDYEFYGVIGKEYPQYRKVIPAESDYPLNFTADRKELAAFVKRVPKKVTPLIRIEATDHGVVTSFHDANLERIEGCAIEPVNAETWHGGAIAYNAGYLATVLAGFSGETVRFCVKGEASANTIREGNRVVILMPVRM